MDVPPWINDPLSSPIGMSPSDGNFDSKIEKVEANIDTSEWRQSRHIVFVRGQDSENNWGVFSAIFVDLPCGCDFEPDGDVDGVDLAVQAKGGTRVSLEDFTEHFGRNDCPP